MSFILYSAKVRLGGSVLNEVPKSDLTAPEIEVLRMLHGDDAVVEIKEQAVKAKRSQAEERQRIYSVYANPTALSALQLKSKLDAIRGLFGHDRMPLPVSIAETAPENDEDADEGDGGTKAASTETVAPVAGKRTRVERPAFAE